MKGCWRLLAGLLAVAGLWAAHAREVPDRAGTSAGLGVSATVVRRTGFRLGASFLAPGSTPVHEPARLGPIPLETVPGAKRYVTPGRDGWHCAAAAAPRRRSAATVPADAAAPDASADGWVMELTCYHL
jgi:hypothetical protein